MIVRLFSFHGGVFSSGDEENEVGELGRSEIPQQLPISTSSIYVLLLEAGDETFPVLSLISDGGRRNEWEGRDIPSWKGMKR
jgi:hypothetical protein